MIASFSIIDALAGGAFIGLAAVVLLLFNGKIAGISGICSSLINPQSSDKLWRIAFVGGMLAAAFLFPIISGKTFQIEISPSWPLLICAGLLVGFGSKLGSGCTSGHGICGLSRLSKRSLFSTALFMTVAIVTATAMSLIKGGA